MGDTLIIPYFREKCCIYLKIRGRCGKIEGGSVAEWLKAHDSKSCRVARLSEVRIPSLPPKWKNVAEPRSGSRNTNKIKNREFTLVFFVL